MITNARSGGKDESRTHRDLCDLAVRWLKRPNSAGGHGCLFAVSEARPEGLGECPDAIGFRAGWADGSVLVECKVSRSDFLADKAKPHRQAGGMGTWRYYMAPEGIIAKDDLPPQWGLLLVNGRGHIKPVAGPAAFAKGHYVHFVEALEVYRHKKTDVQRERALLVRLLARLGDVEAMNVRIRDAEGARQRLANGLMKEREKSRELSHKLWLLRLQLESSKGAGGDGGSISGQWAPTAQENDKP